MVVYLSYNLVIEGHKKLLGYANDEYADSREIKQQKSDKLS